MKPEDAKKLKWISGITVTVITVTVIIIFIKNLLQQSERSDCCLDNQCEKLTKKDCISIGGVTNCDDCKCDKPCENPKVCDTKNGKCLDNLSLTTYKQAINSDWGKKPYITKMAPYTDCINGCLTDPNCNTVTAFKTYKSRPSRTCIYFKEKINKEDISYEAEDWEGRILHRCNSDYTTGCDCIDSGDCNDGGTCNEDKKCT